MPKLKKRLITARQKNARRLNIKIARAAKKKNKRTKKVKQTRFGNPVAGKSKKLTVLVEKKRRRKK
jgi:hypothetical protein